MASYNASAKLRRTYLAWLLGIAFAVSAAYLAAKVLNPPSLFSMFSLPSEGDLRKQFDAHRGELEALAAMARQDKQMSRIADDFTWRRDTVAWPRPESEWGITRERWDEYRRLFGKVGLAGGLSNYDDGVLFTSDSHGIVVHGSEAGFMYCEKPNMSETENSPCQEPKGGQSAPDAGSHWIWKFTRLTDRWFIYSEHD